MRCPKCNSHNIMVLHTDIPRRTRKCNDCGCRFSTFEEVAKNKTKDEKRDELFWNAVEAVRRAVYETE